MTLLLVETVRRMLRQTCERLKEVCPAIVEVRAPFVAVARCELIVIQEYGMMLEVAGELSELFKGLYP